MMAELVLTISRLMVQSQAALTVMATYQDTALDNWLFADHVVFTDTTVRSGLDCANLCNIHPSCLTFTFSAGNCQGHSEIMTWLSSVQAAVTGAKTFSRYRTVAELVRCRTHGAQQLVVSSLPLNVSVFCDGDWLVIMRRKDGSVDFYRDWNQYQQGFGDVQGEFWIGLDPLHMILSTQVYDLTVDLEDWAGVTATSFYTNFSIASAVDNYRLQVDYVKGTINDSLALHSGEQFTTYDADNDILDKKNCAIKLHGAWWYNKCSASNLMGRYANSSDCPNKDCITWRDWHGTFYSLKSVQMRIRPAK